MPLHVVIPAVEEKAYLHLASMGPGGSDFPRLSRHFPAAARYEREISGRSGPMRFGGEGADLEGTGVRHFPLGPVRGDCNEAAGLLIDTAGEHILRLTPTLGYKHRGLEETAVGLAPETALLLVERTAGSQAVAHALAYCQALERLAGLEVPGRAAMLRVLLAEMERLYGHLYDAALMVNAAGHVVGAARLDQLKELFLRLNLSCFGHRYLFGVVVPGGVARDLTPGQASELRATVGLLTAQWRRLLTMVLGTPGIVDRWETTGIVEYTEAWDLAAVGPVARAAGVDRDVRRDHPYAAYAAFDFPVPVFREGDALARFRIRAEEIAVSLQLVRDALTQLPAGPVHGDIPPAWPAGEALGWVETPQGETIHWVRVAAAGSIAGYRLRSASFANWDLFGHAAASGNIMQDFPLIDTSFNLSCADCDR
ncbi:MAG: NADH-quinone oxidoreductase subunit F [Peptococcaceae bacterium]|jgi:Ni,Fe-hydrogenase III large subunit|nr:NADH-quinone oxidoreductase subunit F [Peptococcaceae bacterium]